MSEYVKRSILDFFLDKTSFTGGEPGEDTEEFLELQEKLKNPEKMTRLENVQ